MNNASDLLIERLGTEHLSDCVEIFDAGLGEGYLTADTLRELLDEGGLMAGVVRDGQVVAAATARVVQGGVAVKLAEAWQCAPQLLAGRRAGMCASSTVRPDYRRRGLGMAFALYRLRWLEEQGCDLAIAESWLSNDPHSRSLGIWQRLGFAERERVEKRWYEHSLTEGSRCPDCGWPCECTAVLLTADLPHSA